MKSRFKPAKQPLKVGDKVKIKGFYQPFTIFEIINSVAFLERDKVRTFERISDLEKVEEREAPPKFTKLYVWDGDERPERPMVKYSYGELNKHGKIITCAQDAIDGCADYFGIIYENWEVCV